MIVDAQGYARLATKLCSPEQLRSLSTAQGRPLSQAQRRTVKRVFTRKARRSLARDLLVAAE